MADYPSTPFERAVDSAIAEENRRVEATLCRPCIGRGYVYREPVSGTRWQRETCVACGGDGKRGDA